MRWTRTLTAGTVAAALGVAACLMPGTVATAATAVTHPQWAPAKSATIHPGVSVEVGNSPVCRAGFILTDDTHAFIAIPASCAGTGPMDNSKCDVGQDPIGTPATIQGAKYPGKFVYSALVAMVLRAQTHKVNRCTYNDLALVRIDNRDIKRTNPSVPSLGGPTGVSQDAPEFPDQLSVYALMASPAEALQTNAGGWSHSMMVDAPLSATDIGAPVLTAKGQALGMVSDVPTGKGQTLVSDFYRELRYMRAGKKWADVHLAKGSVKFSPALPLGSA
jgi:hypothetical protein